MVKVGPCAGKPASEGIMLTFFFSELKPRAQAQGGAPRFHGGYPASIVLPGGFAHTILLDGGRPGRLDRQLCPDSCGAGRGRGGPRAVADARRVCGNQAQGARLKGRVF